MKWACDLSIALLGLDGEHSTCPPPLLEEKEQVEQVDSSVGGGDFSAAQRLPHTLVLSRLGDLLKGFTEPSAHPPCTRHYCGHWGYSCEQQPQTSAFSSSQGSDTTRKLSVLLGSGVCLGNAEGTGV